MASAVIALVKASGNWRECPNPLKGGSRKKKHLSSVLQNEQEFTKQTRQGRVLLKGNSICKDTSVYGLTPFTGDPVSIGSSSKFKALFNKQAKCKPNHNSFTDMGMLSPENLSTGCKYTVRFLESRRFFNPGHN